MPGPEAEHTKCLDRRWDAFWVTQNADFGEGGILGGFWVSLYTTV